MMCLVFYRPFDDLVYIYLKIDKRCASEMAPKFNSPNLFSDCNSAICVLGITSKGLCVVISKDTYDRQQTN